MGLHGELRDSVQAEGCQEPSGRRRKRDAAGAGMVGAREEDYNHARFKLGPQGLSPVEYRMRNTACTVGPQLSNFWLSVQTRGGSQQECLMSNVVANAVGPARV